MPNGFSGVMTGAAIVFFTYIGFDSVSTAAEECRNPQRDMPFGILMTLFICTLLYVSVALALTGLYRLAQLFGNYSRGEIFTRDGRAAVSVVQEGLIRVIH